MYRDIEDIVETLKNAQARNRGCSLLIGAGCSVKAGIPLAAEFVAEIERKWVNAHRRAKEKTYPDCMAELAPAERRDLIADYVDKAKLNWAHLGIAQLIKANYVNRVLTTNFDPLVMRACALFGEFPAIYDFAASQRFSRADIPGKAIFHLHGQRSGFVLLNTEKEVQRHSESMKPVFEDAGAGRVWIVVGYSGENDPVFRHLAAVQQFDNNLYWVGYQDSEPPSHVRELLDGERNAFFVKGFDADSFFITLCQKLGCFPPDIVAKPFSYLRDLLLTVGPYSVPGQSGVVDPNHDNNTYVREAIERYETQKRTEGGTLPPGLLPPEADLRDWFIKGEYGRIESAYDLIVEAQPKALANLNDSVRDIFAWSLVVGGLGRADQAKTKSSAEADTLFAEAGKKYEAALKIKPDKHEALNNWGVALADQANAKSGVDADALFAEAGKKYEAALKIKPDKHEALNNWGIALADQARTKSGAEADALFAEAGKKYEATLKIKPDKHEAIRSWGIALANQARTKSGAEADALFAEAGKKYEAALKIKPDYHEALRSWGIALADQARAKSGAEADALFAEAGKKYEAALKIKPDYHEALNNWGIALADRAKAMSGAEADALFAEAGKKYEAVLKIKPDYHEALNNWGIALSDQAKTKSGVDADALFAEAGKKYEAALKIKPDYHVGLRNWGIALSDQAKTKSGAEADALFAEAGRKCEAALKIKPDYHDALNSWGIALADRAKTKSGAEADALFAEAGKKYEAALKIKPDYHDALNNWGIALSDQAKTKSGAEADALFAEAGKKYEAALKIKPDYHEALNSWGVTFSDQAKTRRGAEADSLFEKAEEMLRRGERSKPGSCAYNLACMAALRRRPAEAKKWLDVVLTHDTVSRKDLTSDKDLDSIREEPWFREMLSRVP
jgi:Tfp pilus assembly protein PilF